ncbi:hypothetical protein [Sphingomonas nostoxanthinifaciens]|uniref:hypothetical protein n=1 Tax=Sphingomonas nostoxanthinifaciens TaxID=2872652 RepID=UPI001CC20C58|nr:hypothetical protein [Sphingomonas nostoxanthinifaciens]UAK24899.1 hypothetical protein K8P63_01395 [Sphingomonas nostoxanthinifaciens]
MANNMLGMLVGAAIDREDGDSGIKGALGGYLVEGGLKLVAPLLVTYAIGWGVQYGIRKGLHALTGDPDLAKGAMSPDTAA